MMLDSLAQLAMRLASTNPTQPVAAAADQPPSSVDSSAVSAESDPQGDDTKDGEGDPGSRRDGLMARLGLTRPS